MNKYIFLTIVILFICELTMLLFLIYKMKKLNYIVTVKNSIFNKISNAAIIINSAGKIIEFNSNAYNLFPDVSKNSKTYEELINSWFEAGKGSYLDYESDVIIKVENTITLKTNHYKVFTMDIADKKNKIVAQFIEFIDVSDQQELIYELFEMANRDALTGLFNRRYYEDILLKYDNENYLPVAILLCDINLLKNVNDTYGHDYGDIMLYESGIILKKCSLNLEATICRIGGDEFSVIIPKTSESDIISYIENVQKEFSEYHNDVFGNMSISIGYSIRKSMSIPTKNMIIEADRNMYANKRKDKARLALEIYNKG